MRDISIELKTIAGVLLIALGLVVCKGSVPTALIGAPHSVKNILNVIN